MKFIIGVSVIVVAVATLFLFLIPRAIVINSRPAATDTTGKNIAGNLQAIPESETATSAPKVVLASKASVDLPYQPQLENPPVIVKGIYITGWSAGSASKIARVIDFIKRTEINTVVIDIKDYSGYVSYRTGIPEVSASGAENELRIVQPNALIKKLHDNGIYVIARQTIFQDPILAKAHPEWALKNASSGKVWADNKGLAWMDPAGKPVWDYNVAIAKDAIARGFDEVNFDYIRFASDGDLSKIAYPFWDKKSPRAAVIKSFFKYLRENLPGAKISADLFGLSTIDTWDDLGIGQVIESAYEYFDYISPMVYPSHYAKGFSGFQNPAAHPYEVIKYSLDKARGRIAATKTVVTGTMVVGTTTVEQTENVPRFISKLRPWLQDFDLGAIYDAAKVRAQIQATYDALNATTTSGQYYAGWLLWDPSNTYTEGALEKE